jgi:hypothetical protein
VAGATAAGAAIATGPVDSTGVIHGCYTTAAVSGSHVLKLQNAGTSCPKGTTPISWQAGPSTAGPGGLEVEVLQGLTGESGKSTVMCSADHPYVLGGGSTQGSGSVAASLPIVTAPGVEVSSGNGWSAVTSTFPSGPPIAAYVICTR